MMRFSAPFGQTSRCPACAARWTRTSLGAPGAFPVSVQGVDVREQVTGLGCELVDVEAAEQAVRVQTAEHVGGVGLDERRAAELVAPLASVNGG